MAEQVMEADSLPSPIKHKALLNVDLGEGVRKNIGYD
jgi:hypothetical protein